MLLSEVVNVSQRVAQTRSRLEKIDHLNGLLRRLAREEIEIGVHYLTGKLRQGRIGVGYALLREASQAEPDPHATLTLLQVDEIFQRLGAVSGPGSTRQRVELLRELFSQAARGEQNFLVRLILGELRQGALEGIMEGALSRAADVSACDVRRSIMVAGSLAAVAAALLSEGKSGLRRFSLQLLHPLKPMLAETAQDIREALAELEEAAFEFKLDGARVQVHREEDQVRIFSRRLKDVTAALPEIAEVVAGLSAKRLILDGEVLALREDGTPHPFQVTMRRFGRKLEVEQMRKALPLTAFFFDCLHVEGKDLIDRPALERFMALQQALSPELSVPRLMTGNLQEAGRFLDEALHRGHEGIMAKALSAPYEAGSRGKSWLKIKPAYTLDLVVLGAEWGHGRRRGWLSNLHLGARDPSTGGFVMLGKTFKGMTDEMLDWQTHRLRELEISRDDYTVYVRPELVVEVAFNEIQSSPQYPGGFALRFARVKQYRTDKKPEEADTMESVRAIYTRRA